MRKLVYPSLFSSEIEGAKTIINISLLLNELAKRRWNNPKIFYLLKFNNSLRV